LNPTDEILSTKKNVFCGRFAPSPSGPLHFGSLVTALASFVDVKANNGLWWLRIDDIDPARSKLDFSKVIQTQLLDHGFIWDSWPVEKGGVSGVMFQSKRNWWYESAFNQLLMCNKVFSCSCSRKKIQHLYNIGKTFQLETGEIAYPGTCKKINKLNTEKPLNWRFNSYTNDDFIILRKDKSWAYSFAGVIDDSFQKITRVIRGSDLKPTILRNRIIQSSLGLHYPKIIHVPLVTDKNGDKLSKTNGAMSLGSGVYINKQLKFAWNHLEKNMPTSWLERVSKFTESYFF
tara:strand:+ start:956 stop:1822 length:867 start_codon:yes stop_codon:yes gene_type:complete